MNEQRSDFEYLQRFSRCGDQTAFTDLVRRHLDLVFGTALRKIEDPDGAQDIAQSVFSVLARKAWQFAPDDSLPAWLHKTALLQSKCWLRGELRRRRRERTAAELGTTMTTPQDQTAVQALVPLLDDALLSLREKDRTALMLRFYERQSLRQVGLAFGVSEDTAQKRVQSALEKLAEFFQRRGFKTATVAAAAAALEHTTASASAAMVIAVATVALQSAPPVGLGLGTVLARIASLSRAQTVVACLALAAVPLGWQLNQLHAASNEAKRLSTQLLTTQADVSMEQAEVQRLQANAGRLELSVAEQNKVTARNAESARAFEEWKNRTRSLLASAQYQWSDDSAFVRIPKAILPELSKRSDAQPFSPPGVVQPYARELLGLTATERKSLEDLLSRYFATVEEQRLRTIYETNKLAEDRVAPTKVFVLPALGEVKPAADKTLNELHGLLGEERWQVLQSKLDKDNSSSAVLGLTPDKSPQTVRIWLGEDNQGTPTVMASWGGIVAGYQNALLSMFLPEGNPNRTEGADKFGGVAWSPALQQRAVAWLQEQAVTRLGKGERP